MPTTYAHNAERGTSRGESEGLYMTCQQKSASFSVLPFYHEQILQPQNKLLFNSDYKERITQHTAAVFFYNVFYFLFNSTNTSFIEGLIKVRKILKMLWSLSIHFCSQKIFLAIIKPRLLEPCMPRLSLLKVLKMSALIPFPHFKNVLRTHAPAKTISMLSLQHLFTYCYFYYRSK